MSENKFVEKLYHFKIIWKMKLCVKLDGIEIIIQNQF